MKVKNDHRSKFSNLSNWKEEAWKKSGLQLIFFRLLLSNCLNWKFTAMIILYFHLLPQFKYELFHILHIKNQISWAKERHKYQYMVGIWPLKIWFPRMLYHYNFISHLFLLQRIPQTVIDHENAQVRLRLYQLCNNKCRHAVFEEFQLYHEPINSVQQWKHPSLEAVMQKEVSPKEFCNMENWQEFLSLSKLSGNPD